MRLQILFLLLASCAGPALSQDAAFPLESIVVEGSTVPQPVILEIAGLRIASPIDKAGIEQACGKLRESGLFASISFGYAPGPKNGYVLTLKLADQAPLSAATIDVPGVDENETWQWLVARFSRFDHQAPQADAAQKYLAREIEQHLASRLRGQHLTVRLETDLRTRKLMLSFQPEVLPRVSSLAFTGNQAVTSAELSSAMNRLVVNQEYTARRFAAMLDLNVRPLYEQHGLYRVRLTASSPSWTEAGVSLNVAIAEGDPYRLGNVELIGENLPAEAMLSAAKLPTGDLANWKQIQEGIWAMEKVVRRTGFLGAAATPDRVFDDAAHVIGLRIRIAKGALYHFGEVHIVGLSPEMQERVRRMWRPKPGDLYDSGYANEFFQALSRVMDLRFRKYEAEPQKATPDHVMDINLVFHGQ